MDKRRAKEKIEDYFPRVSPKRKRTESGNETEEEPLPSPSVASGISMCFSSDEDGSEIGEDPSVRDEVQKEKSEDEMHKKVTIYKISNKFLPKNVKDDISLQRDLLEMFENEDALTLKEKDHQQDRLEPYRCIWFTCEFGDEENENRMSQFYDQNLTGKKVSIPKGPRRTSNLMILYQVTSDNFPEAFGVCDSYPPQKILYMSDSKFRSDVANALMDGRRIVKLETMNIAGPEIRTKKFFASQSHINCPRLNEVVTSATSFMRTDNSVFAVLGGEKEKPTRMTIQLNCFRFELKMSLEKCAKVLESLRGELNKDDGATFYNFDNVYRDVDKTRIEKYEKELKSAFIDYICDEKETPDSDYSLSHRYFEEWSESLSVQLFRQIPLKGNKKEYKEVCSWRYPPSVGELKSRLQIYYEVLLEPYTQTDPKLWRSRMRKDINGDLIFLSFGGIGNRRKLLTYVHGSVDSRELSCKVYKLAQKWYVLTSAFSKLVDRNFIEFAKGAILSKDEGKLPLPWYSSSKNKEQQRGFTTVEIAESLYLKDANAEKLLDILSEPVEFLSLDKGNNLTEKSCTFLESSRIYKFLRQSLSKDNTSGKTDAINPEEKTDCNEKSATSKTKKSKNKDGKSAGKNKITVTTVEGALYRNEIERVENNDIRDILQKRRKLIRWNDELKSYQVQNANLTKKHLDLVQAEFPNEDIDVLHMGLLRYLRSRSILSEGEYNETYLLYPTEDDKIFIPGDRVCFNNVELFDILMHDSISNVTYLYHVKEGLGQMTRDACSQIRVSAQLFWMDRLQGKQTNALGFYQKATCSSTAESPYRDELRKRMEQIGEEEFINMFQQKLIFVYAYLSKTVKEKLHPADLSDFKPIKPSDIGKNGEDIVRSLKELNILTDLGYLDDTFLDITKDGFPTSAKKNAYLDTLSKTRLEAIYDTLVKHGRCKVSTIAKMELLELNRQFTEYQIAGEKVFELKVVKI